MPFDSSRPLRSEGRRFALSAIWASPTLIIGEQAVLVLWSPAYFNGVGEWVWNLFVSSSFLLTFTVLYGFLGGACWQTILRHWNPAGHLATIWKEARSDALKDRLHGASLAAACLAFLLFLICAYLLQIHFSTSYNNKTLAAFLYIILLTCLCLICLVLYHWIFMVISWLFKPFSKLLPRRLLFFEVVLFVLFFLAGVGMLLYVNDYLFDAIDWRPGILLGLFVLVHLSLYALFSLPFSHDSYSVLNALSLGGFAINIMLMLIITVVAYPSQPRVASILRNQAPLSKTMILTVQSILDRDGDGFSPFLLGGDCDDTSPLIHPMAQEISGNGIDDDCLGGDALVLPKTKIVRNENLELRIQTLRNRYNVLLITIDAVRADHTGLLGYSRQTTPELDRFAAESISFSRAYAQAPNTPQSIPSILSGRYPSQIHWDSYSNFPKILNRTELVIDRLKLNGYRTAGVFSFWYFDNRNLDRNADWWDTRAYKMRESSEKTFTDDLVTDNAIEYLERTKNAEEPLFLWLHYFDPHFLYVQHDNINFGERQEDLYDGEIRYSSEQVGRFLDYWKKSPYFEKSIIIIASDHGEEFDDHGMKYHGSQLYNESIHVPLIVHIPNVQPKKIADPVGLVQIVPTIYDLIGLETPAEMQGQSLLPLVLEGENHAPEAVFVEKLRSPAFPWSMQTLMTSRWKLLYRANEQMFELYDLENDPSEQRDLFDELPEKANEMKLKLLEFRQNRLTQDTGWYQMAAGRQ